MSSEFERGDLIAGKYEVIDILDESPLGWSYRAKHGKSGYVRVLVFNRRVANPDTKEQLIRAYKSAKDVRHDNLIKLGELGDHEGRAFVVMDDFDGSTLRELVQEFKVQGKPFDVKEAAQITIQILEGVEAAANAGFVFRGLRPENVLVKTRRIGPRQANFVAEVRLVGVGFWDLVPSATLAEDEFGKGEAQYMAPELKSFEPKSSERCDVYSSGVMFYEMVVGTAPVGTFQLPRTRRPDLPEHVNNVAESALAHAPEDRYPSARDFIIDIQRIFDGTAVEEGGRRSLLTPLLLAALVMALFFVVLVAIILFNLKPDPLKNAEAADIEARKAPALAAREAVETVSPNLKAILASHPPNMAYVPAGPYVSGALQMEQFDGLSRAGEPVNELRETKAYLIDLFEHPNLQGSKPTLELTLAEAAKACEDTGKRLCTADEWEKACKGPNMYAYSYGDTFDPSYCGNGLDDTNATGHRKDCRSGYGPFDLSGNFREWTSTEREGSNNRFLVKGGVRAAAEKGTRCAYSKDESALFKDKSIGFRCCRDADAPPFVPPAGKDGAK